MFVSGAVSSELGVPSLKPQSKTQLASSELEVPSQKVRTPINYRHADLDDDQVQWHWHESTLGLRGLSTITALWSHSWALFAVCVCGTCLFELLHASHGVA
eukprot:3922749-Amphidinium_carterae.1